MSVAGDKVNSISKRFPEIYFALKSTHGRMYTPQEALAMGSDRKGFSRRKFLSTAVASTAASLLARPAFSAALSSLTSNPSQTAAFDAATTSTLPWKDQGVLNLANSPYAKLHTVPVRAVTINEGF